MTFIHGKESSQRFEKIVMGSAARSGKKVYMDLNVRPRSHLVKRALMNFVLPIAAVAMIATVIVFPSPAALGGAVDRATNPFIAEPILRGTTDARLLIEDYASAVPGLTERLETNGDCFVDLDHAPAEKLEECAPVVTYVIAAIVAHQDNPAIARVLENEGKGKLLPQIQVAAAEVCRSIWVTGKSAEANLDNPACQMAEVALVPRLQMR